MRLCDPNARGMRNKPWPYYDDWCEIFGKDRATGHNVEGFVDAVHEILNQTQTNNEKDVDKGLEGTMRSDFEDNIGSSSISKPITGESSEKKKIEEEEKYG